MAPLFSRFSILNRSLLVTLEKSPRLADPAAAVCCTFSFSKADEAEDIPVGTMLLMLQGNALFRGLSAKIDNFCRSPFNLGLSSSTAGFPVRIR